MERYEKAMEKLEELGITVETVEHEPAVTIELADRFIEGIEGVRTKTMLLTTKKKTAYYLLVLDNDKRLDMELFAEQVGAKRIKMASPESLYEKMRLEPGVVSPFGLLFNEDRDIGFYIDREIVSEARMSFHPNTNEKTIFIDTPDLFRFAEAIGYGVNVIDI